MNFKIVTTIKLTFSVECYYGTEGGMEHELFKTDIPSVAKALEALKVAQVSRPCFEWIITANVVEVTNTHEEKP